MKKAAMTLSMVFASVAVATASAQSSMRHGSRSLAAGVSFVDQRGIGFSPMVAARGDIAINRFFAFDGGVIGALPGDQFGRKSPMLVPELGLRLQLPTRIAPYIGADIGSALTISRYGIPHELSFSTAVGTRAWLTERTGVLGEFRIRGIGDRVTGSIGEFTLGMAWR
jgi:hypothetical protein